MRVYAFLVTVVVAIEFIASGIAKLRRGSFAAALDNYNLLPPAAVPPVAFALPWAEVGLGGWLLAGGASRVALVVAALFLILFAFAMTINLVRGRTIACGCRGSDKPVSGRLVAGNVALACACLAAVAGQREPLVGAMPPFDIGINSAIPLIICLASGACLWQQVELLVRLRQLTSSDRAIFIDGDQL